MTEKEKKDAYEYTIRDIIGCCCDNGDVSIEDVDGICPECGRATCGGYVICKCDYSPIECETCGAAPCDQSC